MSRNHLLLPQCKKNWQPRLPGKHFLARYSRAGRHRLRPRTASTFACYCTFPQNIKKTQHCAQSKHKLRARSLPQKKTWYWS